MIKEQEAVKAKQECHLITVQIKTGCKSAICKIYLNDTRIISKQLFKKAQIFF